MSSLRSKPADTPWTRLLTMARDMPHMAWARLLSERGETFTSSLAKLTSTSSGTTKNNSPFAPLTLTFWPSTSAVTPFGRATGFFPTRDMILILQSAGSEDLAEHFAADIGFARGMIGHDALRRRDDGDAETVGDARQGVDSGIDATTGLRHARDLANDGQSVVILQLDFELGATVAELRGRET